MHALRRGDAFALALHRDAKRAADRLERRLGDVMRVAAGRLDVDRDPRRLREARQNVHGKAGIVLELQLRGRTSAEIDRRTRERVVHRHDGVAVARDAAPVAERSVEGVAERERSVLRGVMVARLEVAGAFEDQVEAGVEGELLEEVVVQPGAGRNAHARRAVEREAYADPRLRGRAQAAHAAASCSRDGRRPVQDARERLDEHVVVLAVEDGDADAGRERPYGQPLPQQLVEELARLVRRERRGSCPATEAARGRARGARARNARVPRRPAPRRAGTRARRARAPPTAT